MHIIGIEYLVNHETDPVVSEGTGCVRREGGDILDFIL
jgi:hypothetical protein